VCFSHKLHQVFTIIGHSPIAMKEQPDQKITITLPASVYHKLRQQAHQQGLSLPAIIQKKITLKPSHENNLAQLSVKQMIQQTAPKYHGPESRLDFFS